MIQNKVFQFLIKIRFLLFVLILFTTIVILNFLLLKSLPVNALIIPEKVVNLCYTWFGVILIVIIGPAFETVFFQMIPIAAIKEMGDNENRSFIISTIVSAILFGVVHGIYSKYYVLYALVSGFVLALTYNLSQYRKEPAFLPVFIIHALWNLLVLLLIRTDNLHILIN